MRAAIEFGLLALQALDRIAQEPATPDAELIEAAERCESLVICRVADLRALAGEICAPRYSGPALCGDLQRCAVAVQIKARALDRAAKVAVTTIAPI
ncbi:MAG TPA: hypothetical protein VFV38_10130 [Ktedonobacteraceae bacterium]|nr:hypothetical protein [Ktedonobacteraceae bacterium]